MIPCNILVVEDSPTQAEALRALLESEGARVEVAPSAEAALERLRKMPLPELVLSDVVMPGMNGYDLTRALKADPTYARIPVVLLTSLSDPLDIVRGLECGADNYVTKPYDAEYLTARIRNVLDQKRMRRDVRTSMGVSVQFLGTNFTINSDREQILDLFISSVEDVVRTNKALLESQVELAEAQRQLESYALQMAKRAHESGEKLRTVVQSSPQAIIAFDLERRITVWNPAAERIFGFTAEEVIGQPNMVIPAEHREEYEGSSAAYRAGESVRIEAQRMTRDGTPIYVLVSIAALRDADGVMEGSVAIVEDITEHKRTAEALATSQAQLLQAQKMEAVGRLAGGIAHDFNNLLTVIRSYGSFLADDLAGSPELQHYATEIQAAADRAAALTRQLLTFSRKQVVQPRPVRVDDVIAGVHEMLSRLVPANIELDVKLDAPNSVVNVDPGQIEQVLMNLAINAADAMPTGGQLTISSGEVETRQGDDLFPDLQEGRHAVITVSDTGTGMDPETKARLFEPFFTTKPVGMGTGLGLSIVYGVVREHHGAVSVYSELGQGTAFHIYLPATSEGDAVAEAVATPVPTGDEIILVVDDDPGVRSAVRESLERFGYTVLEATDGAQALRVSEMLDSSPDLLLTDLMMPEVSGRELVEELEADGRAPKVLLMSGYTDDEVLRRGLADSRFPFIPKPFTREALARKVREVLDSARSGELPTPRREC